MHLIKLDSFIYKCFKNKWKLEETDELIPTYTIPKIWKLKFNQYKNPQTNEPIINYNELILYQYPSHYRHMTIFQYDSGFIFYFSMIGAFLGLLGVRELYKKRNFKTFAFYSLFSGFIF